MIETTESIWHWGQDLRPILSDAQLSVFFKLELGFDPPGTPAQCRVFSATSGPASPRMGPSLRGAESPCLVLGANDRTAVTSCSLTRKAASESRGGLASPPAP